MGRSGALLGACRSYSPEDSAGCQNLHVVSRTLWRMGSPSDPTHLDFLSRFSSHLLLFAAPLSWASWCTQASRWRGREVSGVGEEKHLGSFPLPPTAPHSPGRVGCRQWRCHGEKNRKRDRMSLLELLTPRQKCRRGRPGLAQWLSIDP